MRIARKPLTEKEEAEGQIEWWLDLRDTVENGEKQDALKAIDAAIKMLRFSQPTAGKVPGKQPD